MDDKDLDDAALWSVIDSVAAAAKSRKPLAIEYPNCNFHSPPPISKVSPALEEPWVFRPPRKIARTTSSSSSQSQQRTPITPEKYLSPEIGMCSQEKEKSCFSGMFPSVSLFKEYQNAAMAILEKSDYTMISGNPFIKKSGWRKISFYFNVSFEIKDKTIEFDENRNVQRAEFVVRASMQTGRFSDGWGSCERREKRFLKPNHDIPSTAETRAKNKACQDLLGIGEYRPGAGQVNR